MKRTKRALSMIVLIIACVFAFPLSAFANAPAPADHLTVEITNLPQNAVYADLLIKIDPEDPNYVDFQPHSFADDLSKVGELVDYSVDGYRSFTFHYRGAQSNILLKDVDDGEYIVEFCNGSEYQEYLTQYEDLRQNYRDIKIVLLDEDYHIITVSRAGELPEKSDYFVFHGYASYDAAEGSVTAEKSFNDYVVLFFGFVMAISVATELLVARFFRFEGKKIMCVLAVNGCSQIVMRVLFVLLPFAHLVEMVILEVFVYLAEFFVYKKRFKQMETSTILRYTIIANTASLVVGILLDRLIF